MHAAILSAFSATTMRMRSTTVMRASTRAAHECACAPYSSTWICRCNPKSLHHYTYDGITHCTWVKYASIFSSLSRGFGNICNRAWLYAHSTDTWSSIYSPRDPWVSIDLGYTWVSKLIRTRCARVHDHSRAHAHSWISRCLVYLLMYILAQGSLGLYILDHVSVECAHMWHTARLDCTVSNYYYVSVTFLDSIPKQCPSYFLCPYQSQFSLCYSCVYTTKQNEQHQSFQCFFPYNIAETHPIRIVWDEYCIGYILSIVWEG